MATKGKIEITDRNGHMLERAILIEELTDSAALWAQSDVLEAAHRKYGNECYVFTIWQGSICGRMSETRPNVDA